MRVVKNEAWRFREAWKSEPDFWILVLFMLLASMAIALGPLLWVAYAIWGAS